MFGAREKFRYDHYTWTEIRELVKKQPVVVLPVGSVEDHGPHLPLDTDHFLITAICEEAARRIPDEMLLLPPVYYGFEDHHMDFPGTITIRPAHLEAFVLDITVSVARHGFTKILLADGHGSNMPILEMVARKTVLETDALCAAFIWPSLILDVLREIRESEYPGGMAHACELETSVYLWLNPDAVQMDKAVKEINEHPSKFHWQDLMGGGPLKFMDWWSRISKTGIVGDPTLASAEKGKRCFEACVERLIELVREFRRWEIRPRTDRHEM